MSVTQDLRDQQKEVNIQKYQITKYPKYNLKKSGGWVNVKPCLDIKDCYFKLET